MVFYDQERNILQKSSRGFTINHSFFVVSLDERNIFRNASIFNEIFFSLATKCIWSLICWLRDDKFEDKSSSKNFCDLISWSKPTYFRKMSSTGTSFCISSSVFDQNCGKNTRRKRFHRHYIPPFKGNLKFSIPFFNLLHLHFFLFSRSSCAVTEIM